jgi:hypothetical protein
MIVFLFMSLEVYEFMGGFYGLELSEVESLWF